MERRVDLRPWLDYFDLLRTYEQKGFLEMRADRREVYVTQSALHAMSEGDNPALQVRALLESCRRLQAYAGYRSQEGPEFQASPFAVHVVADETPHSLLYTVLLSRLRRWWWPWRKTGHIDVITY